MGGSILDYKPDRVSRVRRRPKMPVPGLAGYDGLLEGVQ